MQPLRLRRPFRRRSIHASTASSRHLPPPARVPQAAVGSLHIIAPPSPAPGSSARPSYVPYPFMHGYCMKLQYVNSSFSRVDFHNCLISSRRVLGVKCCHFLATRYKKCGKTTLLCHFATFPYRKNFTFGGVLVANCYLYQEAPYLSFIASNIDFPVSLPCAILPLPAVSARSALSMYAFLFSL